MKLDNFKFADLLPTSIKDDLKFQAASECLDNLFVKTNDRARELLIYSRLEELDENTLDDLALQFNIDWYEGYGQAQTLDEKRRLIEIAITQKWHKGTRYSMERVSQIMGVPLEIVEWWEEDANSDLEPYEFNIHIDKTYEAVNPKFYTDITILVNALKNTRSHLRSLQVLLNPHKLMYIGAITIGMSSGKVLPKLNFDDVEIRKRMYLGAVTYGFTSATVLPEFLVFVSDYEGVEYELKIAFIFESEFEEVEYEIPETMEQEVYMRFKAGQPISLEPGNYKVRAIGSADFPPQDGRFDNDIWQDVEITSDKRRYLVNPVVRPLPGSIWENVDFINPSSFVAYGNGVWLVTNTGFRTTISRSADDGLTWEIIDTGGALSYLVYENGYWRGVISNTVDRFRSDDDGITWTQVSGLSSNRDVIGGNGVRILPDTAFSWGQIFRTDDNWANHQTISLPSIGAIRAVAYGNGVWLALGSNSTSTIYRSEDDGLTWEIIDTELTGSWRSIAYGDGAWIMLSASGVQSARSMDDGLTWTPISSITNNGVSIAYGNGTWVVVIQNNRYGRRSNS